jgi:hypothetical protein
LGNEVAPARLNNYSPDGMANNINSLDLIQKDFQLGIKLESIFMPHTRGQRDAVFNRQPGSGDTQPSGTQLRCAHYTSAEAALNSRLDD